jgi:hypothetical protein
VDPVGVVGVEGPGPVKTLGLANQKSLAQYLYSSKKMVLTNHGQIYLYIFIRPDLSYSAVAMAIWQLILEGADDRATLPASGHPPPGALSYNLQKGFRKALARIFKV